MCYLYFEKNAKNIRERKGKKKKKLYGKGTHILSYLFKSTGWMIFDDHVEGWWTVERKKIFLFGQPRAETFLFYLVWCGFRIFDKERNSMECLVMVYF